jgi:uncharacterized membrane protein
MELTGGVLGSGALSAFWVAYLAVLALALRLAPWRRLRDTPLLHVVGGVCVSLMVLWSLRTGLMPGLEFHLLGMTTATLMLGWSLSVLTGSAALVGVALAGFAEWDVLPATAFLTVVLPVTITQALLVLVRTAMPKHFFVYVFVNAFLTGGVVALAVGYLAAGVLIGAGAASATELRQNVLPFFPLMFFPEAFVNGFVTSVLVGLRPEWVSSFRDEEYLHGK